MACASYDIFLFSGLNIQKGRRHNERFRYSTLNAPNTITDLSHTNMLHFSIQHFKMYCDIFQWILHKIKYLWCRGDNFSPHDEKEREDSLRDGYKVIFKTEDFVEDYWVLHTSATQSQYIMKSLSTLFSKGFF